MASKVAGYQAYHASAWKGVPTESNAITVLDLTPLVFESFVVHFSFPFVCLALLSENVERDTVIIVVVRHIKLQPTGLPQPP